MTRKPLYPFKTEIFRIPPILAIYLFWAKKVLFEFSICYIDQFRYVTSLQKTDVLHSWDTRRINSLIHGSEGMVTLLLASIKWVFHITFIYIVKYFQN